MQIERTWRKGTELIKPDVTGIDECKGHCVIAGLTCPNESSKEYLQQRKYRSLILDRLRQIGFITGEVVGVTIGTMGTILED